MSVLDQISWPLVAILCLTVGLAPYVPEPHVWEKLRMLLAGDLRRGIDIFDLAMHGAPWAFALLKAVRGLRQP